jgi:hypothetical protein
MNIPKERRVKSVKLAPYTEEGYLIEFKGSKIYRVYFLGRAQKIVRSLYCVFDKSEPLEEAPKIPENPENTLTQEGRIKYTS